MFGSARRAVERLAEQLRGRVARLPRPGLSPVWWVLAAFFGVVLGRTAKNVASAPTPPLTGAHGAAIGLAVPVVFVALVAIVAAVLAARR